MDEDIKKGLKKAVRDAEIRVTGSVLRWKYKKEGKNIPDDRDIKRDSEIIADQAREIIARRGKNIWSEFKKAYNAGKENKEDRD